MNNSVARFSETSFTSKAGHRASAPRPASVALRGLPVLLLAHTCAAAIGMATAPLTAAATEHNSRRGGTRSRVLQSPLTCHAMRLLPGEDLHAALFAAVRELQLQVRFSVAAMMTSAKCFIGSFCDDMRWECDTSNAENGTE